MLTQEQAQRLAYEWIEAWNSHDLDEILVKQSITTPMHTDRRESIGYDAKVICGG